MANKKKPKINKLDDILSAHSIQKENVKAKTTAVDKVISEKLTKLPPIEKPQKTTTNDPVDSKGAPSTAETKKEPSSEPKAQKKPTPKKEKTVPPIKGSHKTTTERVDYPDDLKGEPSVNEAKEGPSSKSLPEHENDPEKVTMSSQNEEISQDKMEAEELPPESLPEKTITEQGNDPVDSKGAPSTAETKKEPSSEPKTQKKPTPKKEKTVPPIKGSHKTTTERVDYPDDLKGEPSVNEAKEGLSSKSLPEHENDPEKVTTSPQNEEISQDKMEAEELPSESLPEKTITEQDNDPVDSKDASSIAEIEKKPSSEPKVEKKPTPKKEKTVPYIMVKNKKPSIKKSQKTITERVDYPVDLKEGLPAKETKTELSSKSLSEHEEDLEKVTVPPQNEKISQDKREAEDIKSVPNKKKLEVKERFKNSYWRTFFYDAGAAVKDLGKLLKHK